SNLSLLRNPPERVLVWDCRSATRLSASSTAAQSRWTASWVPTRSLRYGCRGATMAEGRKTEHERKHLGGGRRTRCCRTLPPEVLPRGPPWHLRLVRPVIRHSPPARGEPPMQPRPLVYRWEEPPEEPEPSGSGWQTSTGHWAGRLTALAVDTLTSTR